MKGNSAAIGKRATRGRSRGPGRSGDLIPPPYPASWVDRVVEGIRGLPIPSWLFYLLVCGGLLLLVIVGSWLDGSAPFGTLALPVLYLISPVYPVGMLAAIHYADDTARRSFEAFRPALGLPPSEASRLEYELTTLPARPAWLLGAAGAAFMLLVAYLGDVGDRFRAAPLVVSLVLALGIPGFAFTAALLYHTVRQLRLVSHIHEIATAINLLHLAPLYAFSRLSAQSGLVFLIVAYFDFALNPETFRNAALLWLNAVGFPLAAAACFLLPLMGMHRRLVQEKRRLERDVNRRLQASMRELYRRVDEMDLKDADAVNKTIGSLTMTRDLIKKIPTWPWQPGTFTLFFSALALPVVVFVIQTFLQSLLGVR